MTARLRLLVLIARPAVVVLLMLFAATGAAQAGAAPGRQPALAAVFAVVAGFLLFSVAVNDLADEAIDRVNLPGDARRPLVAGTAGRRELAWIGGVAAGTALVVSAWLGWPAVVVTVAGLGLSAGYSVRPVRLADRGAVASLMLPACYVAVPYLLGVYAFGRPRGADLLLLAGLYVGFIGRILLKDFRDVRGDALFGKRTFLVRYGRRVTCGVSAGCWVAGTGLMLVAVRQPGPALVAGSVLGLVLALVLLWLLARQEHPRRDEALISAVAVVGRTTILLILVHLSTRDAGWPVAAREAVLGVLAALGAAQAWVMARRGPKLRQAKDVHALDPRVLGGAEVVAGVAGHLDERGR